MCAPFGCCELRGAHRFALSRFERFLIMHGRARPDVDRLRQLAALFPIDDRPCADAVSVSDFNAPQIALALRTRSYLAFMIFRLASICLLVQNENDRLHGVNLFWGCR
jgi:hypothetical protein